MPTPATAFPIPVSVWFIAVPPASASIPTLLIAVARPKISGVVRPASLPPAAKRLVISTISRSVVAKWLPRSTTADPKCADHVPRSFPETCMIFPILAIDDAASSELKLVETPRLIMVFEKSLIAPIGTPNCPAASATLAISTALEGISFAISRILADSLSNCCGVPSTVFLTPANAVS